MSCLKYIYYNFFIKSYILTKNIHQSYINNQANAVRNKSHKKSEILIHLAFVPLIDLI